MSKRITLAFTLSMPGRASWDNRWTGKGVLHAMFVRVDERAAESLLSTGSFSYSWPDGWCARVDVSRPDQVTLRKMRRESKGFCGYGWMVDSILKKGRIQT
jgi:hypothetical protein